MSPIFRQGDPKVLPLAKMARRLGVTQSWLKAQAEAGRIPALRAGGRWLFSPAAVEESLEIKAAAAYVNDPPEIHGTPKHV